MASLLALSTELIIEIFIANSTVHDALRLASSSSRFRTVWLKHGDQIIRGILRSVIPAFDDAVSLAINETLFLPHTRAQDTPASIDTPASRGRPQLRYCCPRLLCNADLATSACAECSASVVPSKPGSWGAVTLSSSPASYNFIRQLVLAQQRRELRTPLYNKLRAATTEWLRQQEEFAAFLCVHASWDEQLRQGTRKDEGDWTPDDEIGGLVNVDGWECALEVICAAHRDKHDDTSTSLDTAIDEYAVDFAIKEMLSMPPSTKTQRRFSVDIRLPLRLCLPQLLRNADLASSAHAECAAWIASSSIWFHGDTKLLSSEASFYFIEQVVLAYDHRQLRYSLYDRLRTESPEWLKMQYQFIRYLGEFASEEEAFRQGIPRSEDDWTYEDEMRGIVNVDEWEFAMDVIGCAWNDTLDGKFGYLDTASEGYERIAANITRSPYREMIMKGHAA